MDRPALTAGKVYDRLLAVYGPQGWWPGGHDAFEVIVGAVLTQNTAWTHVERALAALRGAGVLSPERMSGLGEPELAELIRPSGTFRVKARRLRAFLDMLYAHFDGDLAALLALPVGALRKTLLAVPGIGPETADAIALYAAGKTAFVIDAYTRRIVDRLGLAPIERSYGDYRALFTSALPADAALYNEYHALLVEHGKRRCTRRAPRCCGCPLVDGCAYARSSGAAML
ncbi:MAG: endonuclease III domain-containing protein [Dehalococcoidia bacterium]|nr:endonuclease III domain-containing protein [Dehalococcoidia bacterium]